MDWPLIIFNLFCWMDGSFLGSPSKSVLAFWLDVSSGFQSQNGQPYVYILVIDTD